MAREPTLAISSADGVEQPNPIVEQNWDEVKKQFLTQYNFRKLPADSRTPAMLVVPSHGGRLDLVRHAFDAVCDTMSIGIAPLETDGTYINKLSK